MSFPLRLRSTLGRSYNASLDDVEPVKKALNGLGYYPIPGYGMTPYPDEFMFQGIERFQRNNGLQVDGIMKPGGETERTLNEVTRPRPITWTAARPNDASEERQPDSPGPANDKPRETGEERPTQEAVIPFIVYEIATVFGMTVAAAYAWWMSMSSMERDQVRRRLGVARGGATGRPIDNNDNKDKCDQRGNGEHQRCNRLEPRWKRPCEERATTRTDMCYRFGYPQPETPREWGNADMEEWYNPQR
jgi:hypothetical protein